jgi:hypothetical protein
LIGLGGVNLVFLQVSSKFMATFPMLPDPIPYSELESLLLQQHFRFLVSFFLSTFSSVSNVLLNCAKDCLVGLGFFPPFLAARKSDFIPFSLSQNDGKHEYCASCTCPHASCTGRNVSRYVPFLGLWDSQYQVASYPSSCCAKFSCREKGWTFWIFPGHIRAG